MKKIVAVAVLGLTVATMSNCAAVMPDKQSTCTVTDKDRTSGHDGKSQMRVYTKECGTFKVADSLTRGNFRSADLYGRLQRGHTYQFTYHGFRSGVLSEFPNITDATEVK